jgi:hypothetical protein
MNALYQDHWNIFLLSFDENGEEEIKYDLDACEEYLERNRLPRAGDALSQSLTGGAKNA